MVTDRLFPHLRSLVIMGSGFVVHIEQYYATFFQNLMGYDISFKGFSVDPDLLNVDILW